jgi:ribulose-phosphate 3-epimerase
MKKIAVAPSILGVDEKEAPSLIKHLIIDGATYIHYDVMDGKFVEATSFSSQGFALLKAYCPNVLFDVHLMVEDVAEEIKKFIPLTPHMLSFHYEAVKKEEIPSLIKEIHAFKIKTGIVINPDTKVESIISYLPLVDFVLIMSVYPGKGGQKFIPDTLEKIHDLNKYRTQNHLLFQIEVDGGINDITGKACVNQGANILVAGSYILKAENQYLALRKLKLYD